MTKVADESRDGRTQERRERTEPTGRRRTSPVNVRAPNEESAAKGRWKLPTRVIALVVIFGSITSMALVERFVRRSTRELAQPSNSLIGPVATDASTSLSTWFCAGGTITGPTDDLTITIGNPTPLAAHGTVTFYGDGGERQAVEVNIPAKSQFSSSARAAVVAKHVAALVELDRGGIAVDHRIAQNGLSSIAPCSSSAATSWYFADGDTELGSSTELSLFNPFGEDAIVDLTFATNQGPAEPAALKGFVVARNSVASIDVGSYVRRRSIVSASVQARVGRLVSEQVQRRDGDPGRLALVVGAPSLGASWFFPNGRTTDRLKERYVLYNPTDQDITAQVDFIIDGAESEPFDLDVPRLSQTELITADESRVPIDVGYSVVVATDQATLVVSRTLTATSSLRSGLAITMGARRIASRWFVADAVATTKCDDRLAFLNPTDTDAAVTVSVVANGATMPIPGLQRVLLSAGGRLGVRIGDYAALDDGSSLLVETEGAPIIVERTASSVSGSGARPDQPILPTVDAGVVLLSPDADSGADSGADDGSGVNSSVAGADGSVTSVPTTGPSVPVSTSTTTSLTAANAASANSTTTRSVASTVTTRGSAVPASTKPAVTATTRPAVAKVMVARPTKASGSTSASMAVPLDLG